MTTTTTQTGTSGSEILNGTTGDDTLLALDGADHLRGYDGNDTLDGGSGNDWLDGGAGNNVLDGGEGDDTLYSSAGGANDLLNGGSGNDRFVLDAPGYVASRVVHADGGSGNDSFSVSLNTSSEYILSGGEGQDAYRFSEYVPSKPIVTITDFAPGAGGDLIDLDTYFYSFANKQSGYSGGNPFDPELGYLRWVQDGANALLQIDGDGAARNGQTFATVIELENISVTALTADNFDHRVAPDGSAVAGTELTGTASDDTLTGGWFDDVLRGGNGMDHIRGDTGDDLIEGGDESGAGDLLFGGSGNDTILGGTGNDLISGDLNDDLIDAGEGDDTINVAQGEGNDIVAGGGGADTFNLTAGDAGRAQTIRADGGSGDDTFNLRVEQPFDTAGEDAIIATGGAGVDTFRFNTEVSFSFSKAYPNGVVTVTDFQAGAGGDRIDASQLLAYQGGYDNGYRAGNPLAPEQGYLRLVQDGADTLLEWDRDGAGGTSYGFDTVMRLQNTDASKLTAANFGGGFGPETPAGATMIGSAKADVINGTGAADIIRGGAGADVIKGDRGDDLLEGGDENGADARFGDKIFGGEGRDTIMGGTGDDELDGEDGDDTLHGGADDDQLLGGDGDDFLAGGGGSDLLIGGEGNDRMEGGTGDDVYGADAGDTIIETAKGGRDTVFGWDYTLGEHLEDLYLLSGSTYGEGNLLANLIVGTDEGADLFGHGGKDQLVGGDGKDYLDGGSGDDFMAGGGDDDDYTVDSAGDTVFENAGEGNDWVFAKSARYTLGANVESLWFQGSGSATGTGNALDNVMGGVETLGVTLNGEAGDDTLVGGKANDTLSGGSGDDTLHSLKAGGTDVADGGDGADVLVMPLDFAAYTRTRPNATDTVLTATVDGAVHKVTLRNVEFVAFADGVKSLADVQENIGSIAADVIKGTAGNDLLDGGAGADSMSGGLGDDTYVVSEAGDTTVELQDQGTDHVEVAFSKAGAYTLAANVENATVTAKGLSIHLTGNALDNELTGNGAANTLAGGAGDDILDGKAGNDTMAGGIGDDIYYVDAAKDVVTELTGEGWDAVTTTLASLTLAANVEGLAYDGIGAFSGTGNAGDNILIGDKGNDTLKGEAGADFLIGGQGNDQLSGGLGNDMLEGGAGADVIDGGADSDIVILALNFADYERSRPNATDVVLTPSSGGASVTVRNVEVFRFADGDRTLDEVIFNIASTSSDVIEGTAGADLLDGGLGKDELTGGDGDDTYVVSEAGDKVVELDGEGADIVHVSFKTAGTYVLAHAVENALVTGTLPVGVTGNALDNILTGNSGKNSLIGGAGNDVLNGGGGPDKLSGGVGDDVYMVDIAGDAVTELAGEGNDRVIATAGSYTLGANVEELTYIGTGAFSGSGNLLDNLIEGGAGADKLLGMAGNDRLFSDTGADFLDGGLGDDILDAGTGKDVVDGGAGNDVLRVIGDFADYVRYRPDSVNTLLVNEETGEHITFRNVETIAFDDGERTLAEVLDKVATGGNDVMTGTDGDDLLDGGLGNDTLTGGLGDDIYVVNVAADKIIELEGEGEDGVNVAFTAAGTYVLSAHVEHAAAAEGKLAIGLTGNALDNLLIGNAGANVLTGGAGSDTLTGGAGADMFVLNSKLGVDTVTDFVSGADKLRISQAGLRIGDGDAKLEGALLRAAPGGFGAAAELVVFTSNVTELDAASAAAAIGSANAAYAIGAQRLFALDNGADSALFLFTSADANAVVSEAELTQLAVLTGTASTALGDYLFAS